MRWSGDIGGYGIANMIEAMGCAATHPHQNGHLAFGVLAAGAVDEESGVIASGIGFGLATVASARAARVRA